MAEGPVVGGVAKEFYIVRIRTDNPAAGETIAVASKEAEATALVTILNAP